MTVLPHSSLWIIGQGAIGSLFAAHAKKNKVDVHFVARSEQKAVNVHHMNDEVTLLPTPTSWSMLKAGAKPTSMRMVLITVKAPQLKQAVLDLLDFLPEKNGHIIISHNGMGTLDDVLPLLASHFVYFCTTSAGALKSGLTVQETGPGVSQWALVNKPKLSDSHSNQLPFSNKEISLLIPYATQVDDLDIILWSKLTVNAVINPITAIYDIDKGEVLNEQFTSLFIGLIEEIASVTQSIGINLNQESLVELVSTVATNTATNSSSMRQDVKASRQTEIDFINGYVVSIATQNDIETPLNQQMVNKVKQLTNG